MGAIMLAMSQTGTYACLPSGATYAGLPCGATCACLPSGATCVHLHNDAMCASLPSTFTVALTLHDKGQSALTPPPYRSPKKQTNKNYLVISKHSQRSGELLPVNWRSGFADEHASPL